MPRKPPAWWEYKRIAAPMPPPGPPPELPSAQGGMVVEDEETEEEKAERLRQQWTQLTPGGVAPPSVRPPTAPPTTPDERRRSALAQAMRLAQTGLGLIGQMETAVQQVSAAQGPSPAEQFFGRPREEVMAELRELIAKQLYQKPLAGLSEYEQAMVEQQAGTAYYQGTQQVAREHGPGPSVPELFGLDYLSKSLVPEAAREKIGETPVVGGVGERAAEAITPATLALAAFPGMALPMTGAVAGESIAGEIAEQAGAPEWGQTVAEVGGGLAGFGAPTAIRRLTAAGRALLPDVAAARGLRRPLTEPYEAVWAGMEPTERAIVEDAAREVEARLAAAEAAAESPAALGARARITRAKPPPVEAAPAEAVPAEAAAAEGPAWRYRYTRPPGTPAAEGPTTAEFWDPQKAVAAVRAEMTALAGGPVDDATVRQLTAESQRANPVRPTEVRAQPPPPREPLDPPVTLESPFTPIKDAETMIADAEVGVQNLARRTANALGRAPVIRQVINLVNPSALISKGDRVAYGGIQRAQTVKIWDDQAEMLEEIFTAEFGQLFPRTHPDTLILRGVRAKPGVKLEPTVGEVFQNPSKFVGLTADQRAYIDTYHGTIQAFRGFARELGASLNELALGEHEFIMPRVVREIRGVQRFTAEVRRRLGSKQELNMGRFYDLMADGIANGVRYNEPGAVLGTHLRALGQLTADANTLTVLRALGLKPSQMIDAKLTEAAVATSKTLGQRKAALRKAKKELDQLIGAGKVAPKAKQAGIRVQKEAVRERIAAIQDEIAGLTSALAAQKGARARAIAAVRGGTVTAAGERYRPLPPGVAPGLQGYLFDDVVREGIIKQFGERVPGGLDIISVLNAVMLPVQAVGDASLFGLQLFATLFDRPVAFAKAWTVFWSQMASPRFYSGMLQGYAKRGVIQRASKAGATLGATEYVVAPTSRWLPLRAGAKGVNFLLTPFARGFTRARNIAMLESFEAEITLRESAKRNWQFWHSGMGRGLTVAEDREIMAVINKHTGAINPRAMGVLATQRAVERSVRFAPTYWRAMTGLLVDGVQGGMRGGMARRVLVKLIGGGAASYAAACYALGQEPDWDPRSARFFAVNIGGQYVGFGGVYYGIVRTVAEMVEAAQDGDINRLLDLRNGRNPIRQYFRSGAAPVASLLWDMITRTTFLGEDLTDPLKMIKHIGVSLLPFAAQSGIEEGPEQILPQFFGLRGFPESPFETLDEVRNEVSQARYGVDYDELRDAHNSAARARVDEDLRVQAVFKEKIEPEQAKRRQSPEDRAYARREEVRAANVGEQKKDDTAFKRGNMTGGAWEREWRERNKLEYATLQGVMLGAGVEFEEREAPPGSVDACLGDYFDVDPEKYRDPLTREIDWDAVNVAWEAALAPLTGRDREDAEWYIHRHTQETDVEKMHAEDIEYIQEAGYRSVLKDELAALHPEYTFQQMMQFAAERLEQKGDPVTHEAQLAELEDHLKRNGRSPDILRFQMRMGDPDLEARLFRWGDVSCLRNPNARALVAQLIAAGKPGYPTPKPCKS